MSLIYLFRRLVLAQVLLSIVSFCLVEQNPGLLLVAGALGALSWYVTEGPTGRPLPRWAINLGALAAVGWLVVDLLPPRGEVLLAMGHFIMWLQVLLLYAHKSNRDYGQVLVLSLLQMVGASLLSVSVVFGLLLLAYCILALFTTLVFQLKSTSDLVLEQDQKAAPRGVRVPRSKAMFGRGYRWHFRFTALGVGVACGAVAVAVFILLPRSSSHERSALAIAPQKQVGFATQVRLDGNAPGEGSRQPVLSLALSIKNQPIGEDARGYLLRGIALDHYDLQTRTWVRNSSVASRDAHLRVPAEGLSLAPVVDQLPTLDARITLRIAPQNTLFTLHPVTFIRGLGIDVVGFNAEDQHLTKVDRVQGALVYEVRSPLVAVPGLEEGYRQTVQAHGRVSYDSVLGPVPLRPEAQRSDTRTWNVSTANVRNLALSIIRRAGLDRDARAEHDTRDLQIARAVAQHLRDNYRYALVNAPFAGGEDPVIEFLFKNKQGHCELFASAHVALCRSIGIPARVVTGYRASEFNRVGGYFVVRESHAHAWSEVYDRDEGWRQMDATPPDEVDALQRVERGLLTSLRELYEHLEFAWICSVVAYDSESRAAVLASINTSVRQATLDESTLIGRVVAAVSELIQDWRFEKVNYTVAAVIAVFILVGLASLVRTLIIRRRRLVALQLTRLPRQQRRSLARRLRFYLEMLDTLERHGHHRPAWQSPFGFAEKLAAANPMKFNPVIMLTEHFYEIRFGYRELDTERQRLIRAQLRQLENSLIAR